MTNKNAADFIENKLQTALTMAVAALRSQNRERVERMRGEWRQARGRAASYCSRCGEEFEIHSYDEDKYRFCPYCMAPMTDEAEDILWKTVEGGDSR